MPLKSGREIATRLQGAGVDVAFKEFAMAHQTTPGELKEVLAFFRAQLNVDE